MTPRSYLLLWIALGTAFGTVFTGVWILAARIYLVNPILRALER